MPGGELLSPEVKALVRRQVPTPLHLEALVRLARQRDRSFQPGDILSVRYTDEGAIERALHDLMRDGLVAQVSQEGQSAFQLARVDADTEATLQLLVDAYDRMPVQLVRAVYERPPEAVQSFADAFRLRPK